MKNKLIKATVAILLFLSLSTNVYAAVKWAGSQDVEEAKAKIVTISEMFQRKDNRIKELEKSTSEHDKQLKEKDKVIRDKDKVIADKEKAILDKEKVVREKEEVIKQLESRISEKEKVIAQLEKDLDNVSSKHKEELESALKDVKELNELLGEVVEENK